jgi:hypothetical protein
MSSVREISILRDGFCIKDKYKHTWYTFSEVKKTLEYFYFSGVVLFITLYVEMHNVR